MIANQLVSLNDSLFSSSLRTSYPLAADKAGNLAGAVGLKLKSKLTQDVTKRTLVIHLVSACPPRDRADPSD
jgi:hypothetical protein